MAYLEICIEGTKGAGKTSTIEKLKTQLEQLNIVVEICAPFTEANVFAQQRGFLSAREMISASSIDNQEEVDFICCVIDEAKERAMHKSQKIDLPVVLIYDRGWITLMPHLFGGRWKAESGTQDYKMEEIWQRMLKQAPPTIFLHASYEITKKRRSRPDVIGGLDTDEKLRLDVEERKLFVTQHKDKIAFTFNTGEEPQENVVTKIASFIAANIQGYCVPS